MLSTLRTSPQIDNHHKKYRQPNEPGYLLRAYIPAIPDKYRCTLCGNVLKNPIQTPRGNSACQACYEEARGNDVICPIDKEPVKSKVFRDKAKEREINQYECQCVNNNNGCQWNGTLLTLQEHLKECRYEEMRCEFCDVTYKQTEESEHLKTCEGIHQSGSCVLRSIGCPFKSADKGEMALHLQTNVLQHLLYQAKYSNQMVQMFDEMTATSLKQNEEHALQTNKLVGEVNQLKTGLHDAQLRFERLEKMLSAQASKHDESIGRASNSSEESANGGSGNNSNKQNKLFKELTARVNKHGASINELDLRFQLHENTTENGCILWKIDRFAHRKQQALLGNITALHSAPSYTDRYGYKYCARLYPYGDGMGKGTHLSLFIVLMKSEYDNLLDWPFTKQVKFTLINQTSRQKDSVENLVGNKDSSSFRKPVKDMNVASGCPLFASLETLEKDGFIKDDCLYIEIKVF